jgi:hypothetical protein
VAISRLQGEASTYLHYLDHRKTMPAELDKDCLAAASSVAVPGVWLTDQAVNAYSSLVQV